MKNISSIEQVEQYAAANGLALSPNDKKKIAAAQRSERERLEATKPVDNQVTFADRWNRFYPRLLETIVSAGETVLTFSQTLIVSLGVPVVLVLLLIVEQHRVVEGILLFDASPTFASFAAWALVVLNLVLEFQVHHIEHSSGYNQERGTRWSLRIQLRHLAYRLGLGDDWQEELLSPAERYRRLLRLVTFTILALALVGSMKEVIAATPGAWYNALWVIVSQSDLLLIMTWAGGLLFAAAAVLSAQGLSRYVAIRCVEIISTMEKARQEEIDPYAYEVERAGAAVALAIVEDKISKKQAKEERKRHEMELERLQAAQDDTQPYELPHLETEEEDTQPSNPQPALNGH